MWKTARYLLLLLLLLLLLSLLLCVLLCYLEMLMEWTLLTDLFDSIFLNHSQYAYQSISIVLYYLQSIPLHCSQVIHRVMMTICTCSMICTCLRKYVLTIVRKLHIFICLFHCVLCTCTFLNALSICYTNQCSTDVGSTDCPHLHSVELA